MEAKQTTLTELEERLASTEGVALRASLLEQFSQLEIRLVTQLAGMVPRSEFAMLAASINAARAAQKVLLPPSPSATQILCRSQ